MLKPRRSVWKPQWSTTHLTRLCHTLYSGRNIFPRLRHQVVGRYLLRNSVYSRIWKLPVVFFGHCPCTVHSTCQADTARPMPFGIYIFYWQNDTAIVISLQHASNCIKNTILSLFYIKLVVYYNKRSRKCRGIADLKRNPWNPKKNQIYRVICPS